MKNEISKARLKKVGSGERKSTASHEIVAFKNGNVLATLYAFFVAASAILCMLWAYPASMEADWLLRLPVGFVIMFVALFCSRLLLGIVAPDLLKRNSRLLMLCTIAIFSIIISAACVAMASMPAVIKLFGKDAPIMASFLFPNLLAPTLATLLAGPSAGISIGIGVMFANMIFVHDETMLPAFAMGLITAVVITGIVATVRRRAALLRTFILGGCMQLLGVVVYLTITMARGDDQSSLGEITLFCTVAIALSTILSFTATIVLLPILEHFFGACSNIRLNEFADLVSPLLQKLSLEAPGTYHHSIVVATLAAAAAERIGANPLVARVGSYYHDIGKLTKPSFYTENIRSDQSNPHDTISPNMSAVIISAHVKEGIGLSLHYNLPAPVRDIIREHHGTSVMGWFLHKAKEEAKQKAETTKKDPETIDESQFRYPGPRPTTREAGIVLLADCVEAASRSLEKTTHSSIENLIDNIVKSKIDDEQLDCCRLTFIDIACIKRTFTTTLANILHPRIAYPKDDGTKEVPNDSDNRNTSSDTPD